MTRKTTRINRSEVYKIIDGERDYQDEKWNIKTTSTGGKHTIPEFLFYMEDYLHEARNQLSRNPDPEASKMALHTLRKIVALGVACMEQNGAFSRPVYSVVDDGHQWYIFFGGTLFSGPFKTKEEAETELEKAKSS